MLFRKRKWTQKGTYCVTPFASSSRQKRPEKQKLESGVRQVDWSSWWKRSVFSEWFLSGNRRSSELIWGKRVPVEKQVDSDAVFSSPGPSPASPPFKVMSLLGAMPLISCPLTKIPTSRSVYQLPAHSHPAKPLPPKPEAWSLAGSALHRREQL